jgi:hypothetical protein
MKENEEYFKYNIYFQNGVFKSINYSADMC